jgi:HlyD family secretion protein
MEIVDPGKLVAAGDVVARLDGGAVAEALAAAESERRAAQDELRAARDTAALLRDRLVVDERLQREGALTRERLSESRAETQSAEAKVVFLQQDVPLRLDALDRRIQELTAERDAATVKAPIAGTVYRTQVKKGELAHLGDPLLWIADLERLRVRANVDQVDLGRVQPGQQVRIASNAFPSRSWSGHLTEITPHVVVRENRSISEGLAQIDPPAAGLVPGMTVDVEIIVSENQDVLQVAADAVLGDQRQPFVYRLDGSRIRRTAIRIGRTNATTVEILEGLSAGDRVVVSPGPGLVDDARVESSG